MVTGGSGGQPTTSPHPSVPLSHAAGRTYRYWWGPKPLYRFGHGLSYTTFQHSNVSVAAGAAPNTAAAEVTLSNRGGVAADHVLLLFLTYTGAPRAAAAGGAARLPRAAIPGSGCINKTSRSDLVQALAGYQRVAALAPGESRRLRFGLALGGGSSSAWAGFGDPTPPCGEYSLRFGTTKPPVATLELA